MRPAKPLVFTHHIYKSMFCLERVDAVSINDIRLDEVVTKSGTHRITGLKHFHNLTVAGDLTITGELNGQDFNTLIDRIALTDREETFTGTMVSVPCVIPPSGLVG